MLKCVELSIENARKMDLSNYDISLKLDGFRCFFVNDRLISERGIDNTHKFPHILKELKETEEFFILDGEMCLSESSKVFDITTKANWNKANYYILDILEFNGTDLRSCSFTKRQNILKEFVLPIEKEHIKLPKTFNNLDVAWDYITKNKLEGLVIKNINSPYPKADLFKEVRSPVWFKIKHIKERLITFNGFEPHPKGVLLTNKDLRVNLNGLDLSQIAIKEIQQNGSVCASVVYLYQNPSGRLFQPRIKELVINNKVIRNG